MLSYGPKKEFEFLFETLFKPEVLTWNTRKSNDFALQKSQIGT